MTFMKKTISEYENVQFECVGFYGYDKGAIELHSGPYTEKL